MKNNEQILAGLKDAILTEHTGNQFYETAAEKTTDKQGQEVFRMLAAEEALHQQWLKQQYAFISAGKHPEPLVDTTAGAVFDDESPVFSRELKDRIGEAHWEMTALSVGLQLELATIERYRGLASEAGVPELEHFFLRLMHWEEGHARALERQSKLLRDAYWAASGFAPF